MNLRSFRGDDPAVTVDERHNVPILRFESVESISWDTGSSARYIVEGQYSLPIDVLLMPRSSDRLIVAFHGAESSPVDLPKFQFTRSMEMARSESVLFLSDSSLLLGDNLGLAWMAGTPDFHLAPTLAEVVRNVALALGVKETVLIGHSAGGFAAVAVGSQVPNSRAISVNGQTLTWEYEPWVVEAVQKIIFPGLGGVDAMIATYPERFDLRQIVANRVPSSSFTHFAHRADQASFGRMPQFPRFAESFGMGEDGGRTPAGDALVPCWWDVGGGSGHAIPGTILPFLNLVLGEKPSRDIVHEVDPRWYR